MHFLSHYYLDRNKNNPLFVAGALLPDIAPHFTKTYNSRIRNKEWDLDEPIVSVHNGILRHYELDAVFHNSVVFKESCTHASTCMANEGLNREKYRFWFLGHIVTEVMLDRQLILDNPGLVEEYYEVLNSVDIGILEAYVNNIASVGERSKILSNFIKFLDAKFLRHLENIDGAAEGIVRTVLRATGVIFNEDDKMKLIAALHNIEAHIRYRTEKLLEI